MIPGPRTPDETVHAADLLRADAVVARSQGRLREADRLDRLADLLMDETTAGCDR